MARKDDQWRPIAWALGAHDAGTDVPAEEDNSEDATDFRGWSEARFGPLARQALVIAAAIKENS